MPKYLAICSDLGRKLYKVVEAEDMVSATASSSSAIAILSEEEFSLLTDFVNKSDIFTSSQSLHRKGLAAQFKARLMRIFGKVYIQHIDFSPLSIKDLHALNNYFIGDIEDLKRQAESARRLRRV